MDWPASLCYYPEYSYSVNPDVVETVYASGRSRSRNYLPHDTLQFNTVYSFYMIVDDTDLATFEDFWRANSNGADDFLGDYYVGSIRKSWTGRIVNGEYKKEYLAFDLHKVSFKFELTYRIMTEEVDKYNEIIANGGFP